ncbi:His-Xaa-Ser system protein HxsD [Robiginitalea marina]|uniref:His-Xaa-Ser system protein HxsD n=1 Tax=Robiginitalea marina TaxID=2954105 RepID=A0ABT1AZR0_9FLAO|nr:His-Xaa-Ser system protein HxsD [Robiginitalea marina]MCO5725536.1 His-Xaa-Ser system protein HxsD [Robiginitalea marina]
MSDKLSSLQFKLDSRVYSKNSIIKCLYWYSDDFEITININDDHYFIIELIAKEPLNDKDFEEIRTKLNQDFIDFNLRDIVSNETKTIRELIIAKAFSHGEYDEEPKGDFDDPLGIKMP